MVTISALWLPILVSAALVWIASALIWTVLPHHKSDYSALPDEEGARRALAPQNLEPGVYNIPHVESMEAMKEPEVQRRFEEGPVAFMTVFPRGVPGMTKKMAMSFVFNLVVAVVVAYVVGRTLDPGASYLAVFRVAGTVTWLAYGAGVVPDAIWFGKPWGHVVKHLIDSLVYGLLTAGTFGWLWPA